MCYFWDADKEKPWKWYVNMKQKKKEIKEGFVMEKIWMEMYEAAKAVQNERIVTLGELTPEWWI